MKYTLNAYGWSMESVAKELTDEQVQIIKDKMEEEGYDELYQIRFELDELLDIDIWDGDLFHHSAGMDNGTIHFEVIDEEGNKVLEFDIKDMADLYETIENYDELYGFTDYNAYPQPGGPKNVYLSVDENKGGINSFEFESDTVPVASDFTYSSGSVGTPEGDWDFVDRVFFKGKELEILDWLDNSGKSSTPIIYCYNEGEYLTIS
jgi:hypothetical protein